MFINQCGVLVRYKLSITIEEWNKSKKAGEESNNYVTDDAKDDLWQKLIAHFILPLEYEEFEVYGITPRPGGLENRAKVKEWALSKMAELYRNHKKSLYAKYVVKKKTPDFKGVNGKLREQWPDFVQYKKSDKAKAKSAKNALNDAQKKYHHKMGTGGYKSAVPKWRTMENKMSARGVTPCTDGW